MENSCPNCDHPVAENYCPHCGQKRYRRIDRKYVIEDLQNTVLHVNRGFFYTILQILRNPGKTARAFIEGRRIWHYKPLTLVFVLAGISTFLAYKVMKMDEWMLKYFTEAKMQSDFMVDYVAQIPNFYNLMLLFLIPFFALTTKIAFRKWGHTYYEHIVMCTYIMAYYTLISLLLIYPVLFFLRDRPVTAMQAINLSYLVIPVILIWFFMAFYSEKSLKSVIGRVFGSLGLVAVGYVLLLILVTVVIVVMMLLKGPEYLEYFAPPQ